jgi:hypothetical protein
VSVKRKSTTGDSLLSKAIELANGKPLPSLGEEEIKTLQSSGANGFPLKDGKKMKMDDDIKETMAVVVTANDPSNALRIALKDPKFRVFADLVLAAGGMTEPKPFQ